MNSADAKTYYDSFAFKSALRVWRYPAAISGSISTSSCAAGYDNPFARKMMRFFGSRTPEFATLERDTEQDREHVLAIARAIDNACRKVEAERAGLQSRLDQVLALASTVGGNDIEDRFERDKARSRFLKNSDIEIALGQERLQLLDEDLDHFRFLKAVLKTRFPR